MVNLIFSLLILVVGVWFLYSAYKTNKTKEVKLNIHKIINPSIIRNKEQYVKTYCKWSYILGVLATIEGIVGLTSSYVPSIGFAFDILNIILMVALFMYMFKIISMLCKS